MIAYSDQCTSSWNIVPRMIGKQSELLNERLENRGAYVAST